MLVTIHNPRYMADEFVETIVLRFQLGHYFMDPNSAQANPANEPAQRRKTTAFIHQARHTLGRQHRLVESQTRVPANLHRPMASIPFTYRRFRVRRIN